MQFFLFYQSIVFTLDSFGMIEFSSVDQIQWNSWQIARIPIFGQNCEKEKHTGP